MGNFTLEGYAEITEELKDEQSIKTVRENLSSIISPKLLNESIDYKLKYWGRVHPKECLREIRLDTEIKSSLGNTLKKFMKDSFVNNPAPIFKIDNSDYEKINSVVMQMPTLEKEFVTRHYVIDLERTNYRNGEVQYKYAKRIGVSERTYKRRLKECKQKLFGII